jgi:hypothetical protein
VARAKAAEARRAAAEELVRLAKEEDARKKAGRKRRMLAFITWRSMPPPRP